MKDLQFKGIDENGNIVNGEILHSFEKNGIKYVVYTDNSLDEEGNENIFASRYIVKDDKAILMNVESEEEFDMIDKEILEFSGDAE